jgi:hypothetical protein
MKHVLLLCLPALCHGLVNLRGKNATVFGTDVSGPLLSFPDQEFSTPDDPNKNRVHYFVVGPETSGTRLISKIIGQDLKIPKINLWNAHTWIADEDDAIFHVSFPWGGFCPMPGGTVPTLSTWGGQYNPLRGPAGHPGRLNVDIPKLLNTYASKHERAEVVLVARDPEVSLRGKMDHHCYNGRAVSLEEQNKAFELMIAAKGLPHVHTVCYEELVKDPHGTISNLRHELNLPDLDTIDIYDGNAKYKNQLPETYPCTESLKLYRQLCPNSEVSKAHAHCA